jgi:hypothetical protein
MSGKIAMLSSLVSLAETKLTRARSAARHSYDHEISLCDPNSEDDRRRRKIGSLRRKAIHALRKKRARRRVDFRFPADIPIEDVRDAEEERAVAAFRDRLAANRLLPHKHDDYHMMLRFCQKLKNALFSSSSSSYSHVIYVFDNHKLYFGCSHD